MIRKFICKDGSLYKVSVERTSSTIAYLRRKIDKKFIIHLQMQPFVIVIIEKTYRFLRKSNSLNDMSNQCDQKVSFIGHFNMAYLK